MEKIIVKCVKREKTGKEIAKKLRKQGMIPAVMYGHNMTCALQIPVGEMKGLRAHHFSESSIIDLVVDNSGAEENFSAVIKDIQFNPLTEEVSHLDFLQISLEEKIRVRVGLAVKGECPAIKEGGVLEQMLWEVEIEAYPLDIPEHIDVDVSSLVAGHSIHVGNLKVSDKVRILTHGEETVATVIMPGEEAEEAPAEEEAAAAEPEVIKEKKEEGGGEKGK